MDLDKRDWKVSVSVTRKIDVNVEISRSGNGVHIWYFFAEAFFGRGARLFGKRIQELSMLGDKEISFDRMSPNQDTLPKGGFGNLIALPLQG